MREHGIKVYKVPSIEQPSDAATRQCIICLRASSDDSTVKNEADFFAIITKKIFPGRNFQENNY